MDGTFLGKIVQAEFGTWRDGPFLIGLQLEFRFDGNSRVNCEGRHAINSSEECRWGADEEKNDAHQNAMKSLND